MTTADPGPTNPFAELASEPPETSVAEELRSVGTDPDEGATVPADSSQ